MLALAKLFDEWRNEKWLCTILDGRRRYVYGELDEWQCLQTLYDEHAEIALAIDQLPTKAKLPVAILWLLYAVVNRVEGDAKLPDSYKKRLLTDMPGYLSNPESFLSDQRLEVAEDILWNVSLLLQSYLKLALPLREVILEGIKRATSGKLARLEKSNSSKTLAEYNLQCHLHSGLVWIMTTKVCSVVGVECPYLGNEEHLSNALGLLWQKSDWLRGIREHIKLGESPWPQSIWELYTARDLRDLMAPENRRAFQYCQNHICLDAAKGIPDVYRFLSRLEDPSYFRLCAIPQMVAIMRVLRSYAGPPLLGELDCVRKGEIATLYKAMMGLSDFRQILSAEVSTLRARIKLAEDVDDPLYGQMLRLLETLGMICGQERSKSLSLMQWELSTGTFVELLIMAVAGVFLTSTFLHH